MSQNQDSAIEHDASDPTDEQAQEMLRRARLASGLDEQGKPIGTSEFSPVGDSLPRLPRALDVDPGTSKTSSTWNPPCVSCGVPMEYLAKNGVYGPQTTCTQCRSNSVQDRLKGSGISEECISGALSFDGGVEVKATWSPSQRDLFARAIGSLRELAELDSPMRIANPFAYLTGNNGTGKSMLADIAVAHAIRRGRVAKKIRFGKLLDAICDAYGEDRAAEMLHIYGAKIWFLAIDDVGMESPTDHAIRRLFGVLDDRVQRKLPTIITSNYKPTMDSLGRRLLTRARDDARKNNEGYDDTQVIAILERIAGAAKHRYFVFDWQSHRTEKRTAAAPAKETAANNNRPTGTTFEIEHGHRTGSTP